MSCAGVMSTNLSVSLKRFGINHVLTIAQVFTCFAVLPVKEYPIPILAFYAKKITTKQFYFSD